MYDNIIVNAQTPKYTKDDKGQRYLMEDCFGGDDINGYTVRWRHGAIYKIKKGDTLQSLKEAIWNAETHTTHWEAIVHQYDDERPWLNWDGYIIQNIAKSLGV